MRLLFFIIALLFLNGFLLSQDLGIVRGVLIDSSTQEPIELADLSIMQLDLKVVTNHLGEFSFNVFEKGFFTVLVVKKDFVSKRLSIECKGDDINLGRLFLEPDIRIDESVNLISLSADDLFDDAVSSNALSLLQSTKDIFLTRAAFDFGQAFFKVRGYDSKYGEVLLNGLPMNKMFDGRPQWNNWGGLNDVIRNQQFANGLELSESTFGGVLGTTSINLRPSLLRSGTRLSSSVSNRTYTGRLMATYNSGLKDNKLAYMISGSRRWAKEGYIDGTLYDAYSLYGSLEYLFNESNSVSITGVMASNRRGRSSAITQEVLELKGKMYNPYWGLQDGRLRNSRERNIREPLLILDFVHESKGITVSSAIGYQTGFHTKSRLGYYNAPNPDPTYYRYLPSFYLNSSIGANFESAQTATKGFLKNSQLDWSNLYRANSSSLLGGKAVYLMYEDVVQDNQLTASINGNIDINERLRLDLGGVYKRLNSNNYAEIKNLLGASFYEDIDTFSNTRNNLGLGVQKGLGEKVNYYYKLRGTDANIYTQLEYDHNGVKAFLSTKYSFTAYQRNGNFENERYIGNSLGKSNKQEFINFSSKMGMQYRLSGRHWIALNSAIINKAPVLQNVFINPRESNGIVPNLKNEKITSIDASYFIRMPSITGRFTGYYTRFQNLSDINFFYVDSGFGSDFVQEVVTNLDKVHSGLEVGLEYQLSSSVKLNFVSSIAKHVYANNPSVTINFDTASTTDVLISDTGIKNLGNANVKQNKLAQGPQTAMSVGLAYKSPKYWWVSGTANYLGANYSNISMISRTDSFAIDPETGLRFPDATDENIAALLSQKTLDDFYLLNLVGGKSWLKKGKYISVFASVNNVFNSEFRTGGYEQSRNGNYGQMKADHLSGTPSFAPKYWYGFGRTYFLNLAYSF